MVRDIRQMGTQFPREITRLIRWQRKLQERVSGEFVALPEITHEYSLQEADTLKQNGAIGEGSWLTSVGKPLLLKQQAKQILTAIHSSFRIGFKPLLKFLSPIMSCGQMATLL